MTQAPLKSYLTDLLIPPRSASPTCTWVDNARLHHDILLLS